MDYGARFYDASVGRWLLPDALSELEFSLTPFRYCHNSPVNYTDPFGLWEKDKNGNYSTTDKDEIERLLSFFRAETDALNNYPTIDQINTFISAEEKQAGSGKTTDGNILGSTVNVNGYKNGNRVDWYVDQKSLDNAWHGVQGTLTPDALDPRTLGHNLLWTSYAGGNNPKKYNGKDDYSYFPSNPIEHPAITHDLTYDKLNIKGLSGLLFNTSAISADWKFVASELLLSKDPRIGLINQMRAKALGIGLGALAAPKTVVSATVNFATAYEESVRDSPL